MAEIKNVDVQSDKVVITFEKDYVGNQTIKTLTNRYYIVWRNRWDFDNAVIERYFIDTGLIGCYLGERMAKTDKSTYDVWDLTKIFPNVHFNDNTKEIEKLIEF